MNPTKAAEPTVNNREFISMHGNSTNFIEARGMTPYLSCALSSYPVKHSLVSSL